MDCLFLGTSGCLPEVGEESPMLLLNGSVLVDCGWNPVAMLREKGVEPRSVKTVVFTHMHHDHYMGLVQLLFYFAQAVHSMDDLEIAGPAEEVEAVTRMAWDYLQMPRFYPQLRFPRMLCLRPGDTVEAAGLRFDTIRSRHPVPGLMYRVTETETGKRLGITGDTVRTEETVEFFHGCDALVHETAMGVKTDLPPMAERVYGHSTLAEAIECADAAGVPLLLPIHMTGERLAAAKAALPGMHAGMKVVFPESGMRLVL